MVSDKEGVPMIIDVEKQQVTNLTWVNWSREELWFGLVLWHINHYRSFNAKSFLYIYIKYMIFKHILEITFLNKPQLIFFTLLNGFTYFYQIQIILFTIDHFFAHSLMFSSIAI